MGLLGFGWGLGGVLAILIFAVYRLAPIAFELTSIPLSALQWTILLLCVIYMAYAEGYKGFHKGFAPRVVSRANYLLRHPSILRTILAPLFCMGYIYATPKRMILSISLTAMIIVLVVMVRLLSQPWRGIVDAGVVVGLVLGICSIVYYLILWLVRPGSLTQSPELSSSLASKQEA